MTPKPQPTGSGPENARVIAELQAVALAIRMFGLDALKDGRVVLTTRPEKP